MEKQLLKRDEVKNNVISHIRTCLRNKHLYIRERCAFVLRTDANGPGEARTGNAQTIAEQTFNHVQGVRKRKGWELYTEEEKQKVFALFEHYWNFYMIKLEKAEELYNRKYQPIVDKATEIAKSIPWVEYPNALDCGSAIVYFDHDSEIGQVLITQKELVKDKHPSSRIFAASIRVPAEGQSIGSAKQRACAMAEYLRTAGLPAKVYSWLD